MQRKHQSLIEDFKNNSKAIERARKHALLAEIIAVLIVILMKTLQSRQNLTLNAIGTVAVGMILALHFTRFNNRDRLYREKSEIVLQGFSLESQFGGTELCFFHDYIKNLSYLGELASRTLFDNFLVYFFSISLTQLLKTIDPTCTLHLKTITPFSTIAILAIFYFMYSPPLKPLVKLKNVVINRASS